MNRRSPFIVEHLENFGPHYATTLNHWHSRFLNNLEQIRALDYDEGSLRKWEFYLQCCEAIFREKGLEDLQIVLTRPYSRVEV